jgi:cobalt-zinc-cadmium efflux system outer membrane protein
MRLTVRMLSVCVLVLADRVAHARDVPEPPSLPARLTLEEAVRLLRERGLDLLVAQAAVASAEGEVSVAGAIPNPLLGLSYGRAHPWSGCTDARGQPVSCGWLPDAAYGASLSDQAALFDSLTGKRGLRVDVARAALAAARLSRGDAERTLVSQVKQQFVQVLLSQEALRFAREVAETSAKTFQLTSARYRAGAISEADLARVEVAKLEADQAVDTAQQNMRSAQVGLSFLLGVRGPLPRFEVEGPDLAHYARPPALASATAEGLLGQALANRPDLKATRAQRDRAEASLSLARRQRFPDLALSVSYAQQGTTPSAVAPPTFTLGLSFPLPVFYQQKGEIQKAQAELETQRLQVARSEATVTADVESAWAGFVAAEALSKRMEGGLIERARRARDLVAIQYQKGAASLLDFLDAQRTYISTHVEYLQDLASYWTAVFRLEQAVGVHYR